MTPRHGEAHRADDSDDDPRGGRYAQGTPTTAPVRPSRPVVTAALDVADARAAWARALARGAVDLAVDGPHDACWLWTASRNRDGYGTVWCGGATRYAHRVAWVACHGTDVPAGLVLDHRCGTRACVRPGHLRAVSQRENTAAGRHPGAAAAGTGVCQRGHAVEGPNLLDDSRGRGVSCRACFAAGVALRNAARRGHPFPSDAVDIARQVLADAYARQYAGGPAVVTIGRPTHPDDLPRFVAALTTAVPS